MAKMQYDDDHIDGFGTARLSWTPLRRAHLLARNHSRPSAAVVARVVHLGRTNPSEAEAFVDVVLHLSLGETTPLDGAVGVTFGGDRRRRDDEGERPAL